MQHTRLISSVLWYLCFCFCLNLTDVLVKTLAQNALPISLALFFRALIGLFSFVPHSHNIPATLTPMTLLLNFIRAASTLTAITVWMIPLQYATLTSATAVTLISPIFACILSFLCFNDTLTHSNLWAFALSLTGTLIIIEPSSVHFNPALLFSAVSAFAWSINLIATKKISQQHPVPEIMCQFNMFLLLLCLCFAYQWRLPVGNEWLFIIGFSVLGNVRQFSLLKATKHTDLSTLMPLEYSRLIFAALFAIMLYGETPKSAAFLGGALILLGNIIATFKEHPFITQLAARVSLQRQLEQT